MAAFQRLDHLLCDVPDIDEAFDLFHNRLGFPVAWPIGRFWPHGRTCGIALGGANLEFIQNDNEPTREAVIRRIAFQPTAELHDVLRREHIPFTVFEKRESDPELLLLRALPADQGEQLLCTNTLPDEDKLEFPLFACEYAPIPKAALAPTAFEIPGDNALLEIVIGHQEPAAVKSQLERLGIAAGVQIVAERFPVRIVTQLVMKNGAINLGAWPASFKFV